MIVTWSALLAFGSDEGAAALGLDEHPDCVVEAGLYEALVFSCDATVLRKTSDQ